jgi:alpha-methylacyl-CoA racemase
VRIIEIGSVGPGPFCAMMLADAGAEVLRIDRKTLGPGNDLDLYNQGRFAVLNRGRRSLAMDLKNRTAAEAVLRLLKEADALIEGFRPGVMERLGLGPEVCREANPKLVYGRMTGWGQSGPLKDAAGHDITYIALSGALHAIGPQGGSPVLPLNLVGDFAGGLGLAFGLLAAILEARRSGQGQVVDAAMVDVSAVLMGMFYGMHAAGQWQDSRGVNLLDGGAPFYNTYACADGRWIAIGPLEPQFYRLLLERCEVADPAFWEQMDQANWPELTAKFQALFRTRPREEWCTLLEGTDACFAPVLSLEEAPQHPHHQARGTFVEIAGVIQPAPAPRFSRTPSDVPAPPALPGEHTRSALADWGFSETEIAALAAAGAI